MLRRHSPLSGGRGLFALASTVALAALALAACATSGSNTEHGPTYGGDGGSDATQQDSTAPDEGTQEGAPPEGGGEAGADVSPDTGGEASAEDSGMDSSVPPDAPADGPAETGMDAAFVAPICDGVIGAGEYGSVAHEQGTATGQTWYMTWDATNLYVAISGATVAEGDILYVAVNPDDGGTGLSTGYVYDKTDVATLPFAAKLVLYAHQAYIEARTAGGSAWGAPDTMTPKVCTTGATSTTREEVVPWSLVGGLPAAFGWTGYLAANPMTNPSGYIYGQVPADDPGGADAGSESFTKYYSVPNATPGVDTPFADEQ